MPTKLFTSGRIRKAHYAPMTSGADPDGAKKLSALFGNGE